MVTIFKNLTNIIVLIGDFYFFNQRASAGIVGSLLLVLLGAVLAGLNDLAFSPVGYAWMGVNCCASASYRECTHAACCMSHVLFPCHSPPQPCADFACPVSTSLSFRCFLLMFVSSLSSSLTVLYLRKAVTTVKLSKFGMVYYNNVLSLPLLSVLVLFTGELPRAFAFESWLSVPFVFTNIVTGAVGFFLNAASLWCVQATSPSTFSMVGALNKIPLVVIGVVIFSDTLTLKVAMYVSLSLVGGILYSFVKESEMRAKQTTTSAAVVTAVTAAPTATFGDDSSGDSDSKEQV
jgi:GDP-mannose transporter